AAGGLTATGYRARLDGLPSSSTVPLSPSMTIRGGGDPRQAWLRRRPREWACRPGAAPIDAHHCIMVKVPRPCRIQLCSAAPAPRGECPSDREIRLDRTSPIQACPGEGRGLVDEPQALGVKPALMRLPPGPAASDVGAVLLAGMQGFFNVIPSCLKQRHT